MKLNAQLNLVPEAQKDCVVPPRHDKATARGGLQMSVHVSVYSSFPLQRFLILIYYGLH